MASVPGGLHPGVHRRAHRSDEPGTRYSRPPLVSDGRWQDGSLSRPHRIHNVSEAYAITGPRRGRDRLDEIYVASPDNSAIRARRVAHMRMRGDSTGTRGSRLAADIDRFMGWSRRDAR